VKNASTKGFLRDISNIHELWNFLAKEQAAIFGIEDWEIYRRAVESVKEIKIVDNKGVYYYENVLLRKN
jgi:hypothetical protein